MMFLNYNYGGGAIKVVEQIQKLLRKWKYTAYNMG